jgi:aspartate/methionine/tyrosine aminotransferase
MMQIRPSNPVDTKLLQTNPKYKFNPYIDALAPAASIALTEKAKTLAAAGQTIFDLTIGEPDFDTPASIKEAAIRATARNNTHYVNGRGILPLRERIAHQIARGKWHCLRA